MSVTPGTKLNPYETKTNRDNTLMVTFTGLKAGWEQWVLLTSDRHWDSVHSDRDLQKRHLEEAARRGALVVDLGDLFDAMQGRKDRRGGKSSIRPEHQADDYFSRLLETAVEWFEPYAHQFLLIGTGNHESSVMRHNEINLSRHLVTALNDRTGSRIHAGRYNGWIKFQFKTERATLKPHFLYYSHGSGGSSPVTKGVIQTNRRAVYLPDAHTVVSGHIHQSWMMTVSRERITERGFLYQENQMHVQIPSYKSTFGAHQGWEAEKGMAPTPTGAVWMRLYYDSSRQSGVRAEYVQAF